jgi:hypothetical protein
MATPESSRAPDPASTAAWREREAIIARFEEAWSHGPSLSLRDFLPGDGALRAPVLVELVHIDLERRLKAGERVRIEAYLQDFPELTADRTIVLDLIRTEFLLRGRQGPCALEEYQQRFPERWPDSRALLVSEAATISHAGPTARHSTAPDPSATISRVDPPASASVRTATRSHQDCREFIDAMERLRLLTPQQQDQLASLSRQFTDAPQLTHVLDENMAGERLDGHGRDCASARCDVCGHDP